MRTYYVGAECNKTYSSDSARKVASVAKVWQKNGYKPQIYCIYEDNNNLITCKNVAIGKTVKETVAMLKKD